LSCWRLKPVSRRRRIASNSKEGVAYVGKADTVGREGNDGNVGDGKEGVGYIGNVGVGRVGNGGKVGSVGVGMESTGTSNLSSRVCGSPSGPISVMVRTPWPFTILSVTDLECD